MLGRQLGPYRIVSELGSGGMGTVYLAEGPDGRVALKVVHPHLLATPGFFKRFLREAEIGRAVRHENVVRTLDCDQLVIDGTPHAYLVMEYVEGKSLRALLSDLGKIPETLLREIALQVAAGLAAIHEAGIVHRDLKPENVLITDDHEIRIMDLGVAKLQEATIELTREGQFAGSLLYAAPEQFRGDVEVGPSADLYSLGVLLHELATGENPFRRDDPAGVIEAQLKFEPRRIHEHSTETTRFLAELVACLLSKAPGKRFDSAESVCHILKEAERSTWWRELAPELSRRPMPRVRVRRETRLHGRGGDLDSLARAWEQAKAGHGNTVWIDGEAGIGKTRLLAEFLESIPDDAHVLYGSYPPSGGLGGFSDAILGHFGEVDPEERLRPYLTVTPVLVPAFAALVRHDAPPEGAEPIQGDALNAVGVHLMRGLAAEKPTIWIVDDLHFAPKESRDLALSLSRAAEGHRVLLVYTARPGVPEDELAHFERLERFQRVRLGRLGARQVVELLQDAFKSEALAEKLGGKIALKSDGVPFFVFEMIRGLKAGRFIRQEADGTYIQTRVVEGIEVPSAVKDLIEGRLKGLDKTQRMILDVGAVQGMTFDPDLTAEVLGQHGIRVLQELAEVERKLGLVEAEGDNIRFDQNQIQELIYSELLPKLRRGYHTLLAEAHAGRLEGDPTGEDAVFLASHHLQGSRPREASGHLLPALEHLEKSYRNDAVVELTARALDTPDLLEGEERVKVLLRKAACHGLRGEREMERAALDEALALADAGEDTLLRARVRISRGWHFCLTTDYPAAREDLEEALGLAREANASKIEAEAMGNLGSVSIYQGRHADAEALYETVLSLSREMGDRRSEARATGNLGSLSWLQGRHEEAHLRLGEQLAISREIGDRRGEALATGNLGNVLHSLGRHDEAREKVEECLAMEREFGDRRGQAVATGNLGNILWKQGRCDEALAHFEKHLALSSEVGYRRGEIIALGNLGALYSFQGRYEEARAQYEDWQSVACEVEDRRSEALAMGSLGMILEIQGRHGQARARHEEWLALAREIGDRSQQAHALASLASLADVRGERRESLRLHEEALVLRRDTGEKGLASGTLVSLGRIELEQGDRERGALHLDEALTLALEAEDPGAILRATVEGARLIGGDLGAALAALEERERHAAHDTRVEARFRLWELTRDRAHLAEAKRLLDFGADHSPEEYRDSMIEDVPLHRDIVAAWEEHGADRA